jgi:hypothetical protein
MKKYEITFYFKFDKYFFILIFICIENNFTPFYEGLQDSLRAMKTSILIPGWSAIILKRKRLGPTSSENASVLILLF